MIAFLEIIVSVFLILLMVIIAGGISIDVFFSDKEDENDQR